jgi:hypothetical protein
MGHPVVHFEIGGPRDEPLVSLALAEELGAARVYGPDAVDGHTESGAFRDPAGNVFGVDHHAPH